MKSIDVVMVHIGEPSPDYLFIAVERLLDTWFSGRVFLCLPEKDRDRSELQRLQKEYEGIYFVPAERFSDHQRLKQFHTIDFLPSGFWSYTFQRLIYLEAVIESFQLKNVIHIENDVLVYKDPLIHFDAFKKNFENRVAINPVGERYATFAYGYIDSIQSIRNLNNEMMRLFGLGYETLKSIIGEDMVNEMMLLKLVADERPDLVGYLPSLPYHPMYNDFQSCFDPASWGQYIGGTRSGTDKGWTGDHHFIGREIKSGRYNTAWIREGIYKVPVITEGDKSYSLNNLHIHSKQLGEYIW